MKMNRRDLMQAGAYLGGASLIGVGQAGAADRVPWADPVFNQPYIDVDEWRDVPLRHRYVHGGFTGTDARFAFYFPPQERYQGRFFQYVSPVPFPETSVLQASGSDDVVGFAFGSGGYAIGTNQGGRGATATPTGQMDPTIAGYRVSAACAEYSRVVAAQIYGPHRTYGYIYGGSGGAYRTLGGFENTTAWDGAVPYVMGSPMAVPNVFTIRAHALRVLRHKLPQIADAVGPGGGDMFDGLNGEETAALQETLRMGMPARALAFYDTMGLGGFAVLFEAVVASDPGYFEEFWRTPGYLGANPTPSLVADHIQHPTAFVRLINSDQAASAGLPAPISNGGASDANSAWQSLQQARGGVFPVALELRDPLPADVALPRASARVTSGAGAGMKVSLDGVVNRKYVTLAPSLFGGLPQGLGALRAGDAIEISNSDFLAAQTYHRHQAPGRDYTVWDQFRRPDGTPLYPQRPRLLGPQFNLSAAGALETGRFNGKMIVVESLMDYDAFPWQADWYKKKAQEHLGARLNDNYRLWFTEYATHDDGNMGDARSVDYKGVLQRALRDVSAWVERGVAPPASTNYEFEDGQIVVPARASHRRGVQPTVDLTANGEVRVDVRVGESVSFHANAESPPRGGAIVSAAWDFEGLDFVDADAFSPSSHVRLSATHAFTRPGTYFPAVRVTSQRESDASTLYARVHNLGRARVVVSA